MSILLEALRKSENSQKPVEPPTIHGNDHQVNESESVKSSYVLVLIIIALLVIGWLLWQQYHAEESGYSPPVELPAGKATSNVPKVPGTTRSAPAESAPAKAATSKAASVASGRPRTPVETFQATTQVYEEMTPEEKDAENAKRKVAAAVARAQSAAAKNRLDRARTKAAAEGQSSNASTEQYQSPEPQLISYWELPDSVRNGVPVIKFSVLVYADDPANRFVLVNGERLIEGDELKPGVVVEDIRRDGVVFSYKMYKFFVKR